MRDFDDSTLWRISAFERMRRQSGHSGFATLTDATVLPTTLLAELRGLDTGAPDGDVLEVVAACVRHREPALLYLRHAELLWPVTLFPHRMLYHAPRDLVQAAARPGLADLRLIDVEPPGVRAPGDWLAERVAAAEHYRPLAPLLWLMAVSGPRSTLLREIGGTAAYRVLPGPLGEGRIAPGALAPAIERLRREPAPLRAIAAWPGMGLPRASRMLNALYLISSLMVTRTNPAARGEPKAEGGWRGLLRRR
jgi:hypothetical protein